jgi:glycosyltransferase involved in cell wall biosynthesis
MISTGPLVSIIIPTFNRANIILQTLHYVQEQSYSNWECIIVDDGSTDNTQQLIEGLSKTDSRFYYYTNHRKKGAPGARNTGLEVSKGSFVTFFDSDDILLSNFLENKIELILADKKLDIVISNSKRLKDGKESCYVNLQNSYHPLIRFYSLKPINDIPWINSTLIKREFLIINNISWDETVKLHQDIQFNICLLSKNPVLIWESKDFDNYWVFRKELKNIGTQKHEELDVTKKLIEFYWKSLSECSIDKKLRKQLIKQYHSQLVQFCLQLGKSKKANDDFLDFVKNSSYLTYFDLFFLKKRNQFLNKLPQTFGERVTWKLVRTFFDIFFQPVIKQGHFLKYTDFSKLTS